MELIPCRNKLECSSLPSKVRLKLHSRASYCLPWKHTRMKVTDSDKHCSLLRLIMVVKSFVVKVLGLFFVLKKKCQRLISKFKCTLLRRKLSQNKLKTFFAVFSLSRCQQWPDSTLELRIMSQMSYHWAIVLVQRLTWKLKKKMKCCEYGPWWLLGLFTNL